MARFSNLESSDTYLIIDGETVHSKGDGIQGSYIMSSDEWDEGDEAWPHGEQDFRGRPLDVAE